MSDEERHLTVAQSAWLLRVNDDTVRKWFKDPKYPGSTTASQVKTTTWADLDAWCERRGRRRPLPPELLDLTPHQATALLTATHDASPRPSAGTQTPHSDDNQTQHAEDALQRAVAERDAARRDETTIRRVLRERLAGISHARADAAAADRALTEFLDAAEERSRSRSD